MIAANLTTQTPNDALVAFQFQPARESRALKGSLSMDAPDTTTASQAGSNKSKQAPSTARSRSPTNTIPNELDRRHQGSDDDSNAGDDSQGDEEEEEEDSDEEDEEEPRLKYAYLTKHLKPVYRNGDATSSFLAAGDKMVRYPPDI